jgi:hypothetical protein
VITLGNPWRLVLAESHPSRRRFGSMVRRIGVLKSGNFPALDFLAGQGRAVRSRTGLPRGKTNPGELKECYIQRVSRN